MSHFYNKSIITKRLVYQCFFFISVKILTFSASINLLYLSNSAAQELINPSSAICENTKPSARIKSKSKKEEENGTAQKRRL